MAGTYGLELYTPDGEIVHRVEYDEIRPLLDELKEQWVLLLAGAQRFLFRGQGVDSGHPRQGRC